eukprot:gnl/TRDRNA2_/TRDRNA2_130867_c0_seq1.p1 gnl/TRDRNA2_/TRDRNA2_130867_c0~~gnl/TRDRNA2_/TRDRNA2_130867_c0_seq1.p1  ORF type:complete len:555 (+),score=107.00 gnl/TRDRNA2_/TRDRNA2_130867_c0_seq1:48-1712(+)
MAGHLLTTMGKRRRGRWSFMVWLTGLTICYQAIYQIVVWSMVENSGDHDTCGADGGSSLADSPYCVEKKLFSSWREAEQSDLLLTRVTASSSVRDLATTVQTEEQAKPSINMEIVTESAEQGQPPEGQVVLVNAKGVLGSLVLDNVSTNVSVEPVVSAEASVKSVAEANMESGNSTTSTDFETPATHLRNESHLDAESRTRILEAGPRKKESEMTVLDEIKALEAEMCDEPRHYDLPVCVEFRANLQAAKAQAHARKMAWSAALHEEQEAHKNGFEASEERRKAERKAWEASLLQKYGLANHSGAEEPVPAAQELHWERHWSGVQGWSVPPASRSLRGSARDGEGLATVTWEQLRHLQWTGRMPKVACITAIPSGIAAPPHGMLHRKMGRLIHNFMSQDYAGAKQLVLVFHHEDSEAEALAKKFADGFFIKAVAARGNEQLPSTTGLRYGAWSAGDADVIARWDFGEQHHHQRLSTQVRAMAQTARPASIVKQPDETAKGSEEDDAGQETDLIGEKKWMEKFWYPLLGSWAPMPLDAQSRYLVQVEMDMVHNLI